MFGIGMPEMILILIITLIIVGPEKLPEFAKSIGKMVGEFKKFSKNIQENIKIETEINDIKTIYKDIENNPNKKDTNKN